MRGYPFRLRLLDFLTSVHTHPPKRQGHSSVRRSNGEVSRTDEHSEIPCARENSGLRVRKSHGASGLQRTPAAPPARTCVLHAPGPSSIAHLQSRHAVAGGHREALPVVRPAQWKTCVIGQRGVQFPHESNRGKASRSTSQASGPRGPRTAAGQAHHGLYGGEPFRTSRAAGQNSSRRPFPG